MPKKSEDPKIKAIWSNIQANNGLVASTADCVTKVLAGGYACIDDTPTLNQFLTTNPGKLALVPGVLLEQFLVFGVPLGNSNMYSTLSASYVLCFWFRFIESKLVVLCNYHG